MQYSSTQKFIRTSPTKLRPVVSLIKKMDPTEAVKVLPFVGKRAAEPLVKVIKSAIANARVQEVDERDLKFFEIQINEGPRLKRGRAGSRGRMKPYKRRMSHIKVILTLKDAEKNQKKTAAQEVKAEQVEVKEEKKVVKAKQSKKTAKKEIKK
ncbi:50S ribosomal protein L22 [Candidatus Microgenomates bacterium]|nr:50S ribosomal protein L22 [Candidatus Microgenomates bacterium]